MSTKRYTYKVADHVFSISAPDELASWQRLKWHYEPFACESNVDEVAELEICEGKIDKSFIATLEKVYVEDAKEEGELTLRTYKNDNGDYFFELQQPYCKEPNGWLMINSVFTKATLTINSQNPEFEQWQIDCTVTSGIMLTYLLATATLDTLMAHAACVVHKGKAYLNIAKSGTGKSTHARMWLKYIDDCKLLNDDHPIVRIYGDEAIAYGSPWSGKTDCYINSQAPIGGIIRIKQAPENEITRLLPIQAYASLSSSFSGMTWKRNLADGKHRAVEALVRIVPCYVLNCRPDKEAAIVCNTAVTQ